MAALQVKCDGVEQLEKQIAELRTENELILAQLRSKSAVLSQKEIELAEAVYEKQRFEDSNKELMEIEKQRSEDWISAQEAFQRELAEAYRKVEEANIEKQEAEKALAEWSSSGQSPTVEEPRAPDEHTFPSQPLELNFTSNKDREIARLKSRTGELEKEIASLREESNQAKNAIKGHESELEEMERTKAKIMEDLDSERVKVAGLNRELVATNVHVHEGKRKAEQLSADIESRKKENESAWTAMEVLRSRLEKSAHEREEAIRSLTQQLIEQQRKFQDLKTENSTLIKSTGESAQLIKQLQTDLELAKKPSEDARAPKCR